MKIIRLSLKDQILCMNEIFAEVSNMDTLISNKLVVDDSLLNKSFNEFGAYLDSLSLNSSRKNYILLRKGTCNEICVNLDWLNQYSDSGQLQISVYYHINKRLFIELLKLDISDNKYYGSVKLLAFIPKSLAKASNQLQRKGRSNVT